MVINKRFQRNQKKLLCELKDLKKNTLTAKKRTKVLEDLRLEGEIPEHAFQDLKQNYENEIDKLKSSSISIVEKLQNRIDNIEKSRLETEKFLSTLKVQYRTDEIDRETFHRASESTVDMFNFELLKSTSGQLPPIKS